VSDAFRKVRPGEPIKIAAQAWNQVIDQVTTRPRFDSSTSPYPAINFQVRCRNSTALDVARWSVMQITGVLETPTGATATGSMDAGTMSFLAYPGIVGVTPTDTDGACYVVATQPIKAGEIGMAAIDGAVQARVQMKCTGHQYAAPKNNEVGYLESAHQGPFRIMWVGATGPIPTGTTGPGTPWALLLFGTERTIESITNHTTGAVQLLGHGKAATGSSGCDTGLEWYTMTECSGTPSYASSYFL